MLNTAAYFEFAWLNGDQRWGPSAAVVGLCVTAFSLLLILGTSYTHFYLSTVDKNDIPELGGFSIINAWTFFDKRYDFLRSNFDKTGEKLFSFRVLQHQVVAMSGTEARRTFYHDAQLDFSQGYRLLMGGLGDIKVENEDVGPAMFNKRLLGILCRDRLQDLTPTLLGDINEHMDAWKTEGKLNPFKDIYDIVFQMIVRMASCKELATDASVVQTLNNLFWKLEKSATPVGLLLPWFPGTAKKNKIQATKAMYEILSHYVEVRRKADIPSADAIDVLLADGLENTAIVEFVLAVIFSGLVNTGMISCWTLLYLSAHKQWKDKAAAEVHRLIAAYTNAASSEPIHKRLSTIPISAWEDEMPVMESVIRETLRLVKNDTALRRNLADNLRVGNKTLKKGAFMAYNLADVHLNDLFYPEPLKFDPSRFYPPREEHKRGDAVFLGWGTGRHPCAGMKVAKFEIKMILALFLCRYEYELLDASGNLPKKLPQPNRNDIHQARPVGAPCFIHYKKIRD